MDITDNPARAMRQILERSGVPLTDSDIVRLEAWAEWCDQPADDPITLRDNHIKDLRIMIEHGQQREAELVQIAQDVIKDRERLYARMREAEAIIDQAAKVLGNLQSESDEPSLADRANSVEVTYRTDTDKLVRPLEMGGE